MATFLRPELSNLCTYVTPPSDSLPLEFDYLDTNELPWDLPPRLKEDLAQQYIRDLASHRYPDAHHWQLRQAIARYVSEHSPTEISPHQIAVGNGSDELIRSILLATAIGGYGSILVAEPTFSIYGILAQTLGIPVYRAHRDPETFAVPIAEVNTLLGQAHPPVRVLFMLQPNSPTGNPLTAAEVDWLRQLPEDILVVIDEAYFEFCGKTLVGDLTTHPNWLILRTFSKAFRLAGHRVGYAIANVDVIAVLEKVRLPYNLPTFSQVAARVALDHRQELLAAIPTLLAERERLYERLQACPQLRVWPSVANFLFFRLREPAQTQPLWEFLKKQGTLVRAIAGGIRVTIGTPEENQRFWQRFEQGLREVL
ncbi:histidinol-phosphate transaminase [uncultured Thermosynechococcus sp.]|uniref:histidinol-phosphate transaminase n=1 Tax=uncultured Thermosynechococcus sp. TaxID=436945 RepID=UPI002623B213|nr:histidinol-phosphate transaminase [uncultured Thermosynechococcus sp.]